MGKLDQVCVNEREELVRCQTQTSAQSRRCCCRKGQKVKARVPKIAVECQNARWRFHFTCVCVCVCVCGRIWAANHNLFKINSTLFPYLVRKTEIYTFTWKKITQTQMCDSWLKDRFRLFKGCLNTIITCHTVCSLTPLWERGRLVVSLFWQQTDTWLSGSMLPPWLSEETQRRNKDKISY